MDKVGQSRELPLFPLPTILFPGMPMPLHIFEPRYRKLLTDARETDSLFGLSYFDASAVDSDMAAGWAYRMRRRDYRSAKYYQTGVQTFWQSV